ncbi:MAG TPA: tetratricopeptide repeat protein [Burkholderiaceae bacterium]|jgi:predicted negative regulator of RcsB-dependent stress response|nr:tetratricopeptide repeat protein [Burkholderiaceae bacterium]
MATHLDLEEQEQLDQLKHFWKQYGNLITWVLILALGGFAAFNGWHWYQRDRAGRAGVLFDELDRAAQTGDADRATRVFSDMREHYPSTAYAEQAGLLAAKVQFEKGKLDAARESLQWVAANAVEPEYQLLARVRLAGVLTDQKQYDEALKQLPADAPKPFEALVADRRGDILLAQGKKDEAKAAYQQAYQAMGPEVEYRRLIEAKLTSLGAAPAPEAAASAASAPAAGASQ